MKHPAKFPPVRLGLLLMAGVLSLTACGSGPQGGPGGGAGMPPPEVDVMIAGRGDATLTQDLPGRVQAIRSAQVRARVEGVVERRLFREGSDIAAGTPLFQIDPRVYKTAAESAQAELALAKATVDRYKPLLEVKAVSQQEFDAASAKVKLAEASVAKAELDLENASVPAPIAGRIGRALVTEGALVGKGEATQLALIEQLDPIYVTFNQSGSELLRLKKAFESGKMRAVKDSAIELQLEDGSAYSLKGKLNFADLAMDPNTGSVVLRAEFPNPKRELLPGMFVRIRFPLAAMDSVIRLPQKAVLMNATGPYVLVVDEAGKVLVQPVKTGGSSGGDWIIADGLKGGEQVVVNGLQKAKPGTVVKPVVPGAAPAGEKSDKNEKAEAAPATEKKAN